MPRTHLWCPVVPSDMPSQRWGHLAEPQPVRGAYFLCWGSQSAVKVCWSGSMPRAASRPAGAKMPAAGPVSSPRQWGLMAGAGSAVVRAA